jgi:acyl-CoA reductase-like NAD-dependent aldehyde dehydrogenase
MTQADVQRAYERARATQPAWEAMGVGERARLVRRWGELMWERQRHINAVIRAETGKTEWGAQMEIMVLDENINYYAYHAPQWLKPQTRRSLAPVKQRARVYYKPYGVAGFITPWNYPLLNGFQDLVPALIAGNTVLIKPSEVTPHTAIETVRLMHEAGIPNDVVQVVTGDGRTGAALVEVVDYISLTGSTATGRKIAMRAAQRLIPCSLELGGKDPMIILKDANLELAASGTLVGALENCGQVCVGTERVYVEDMIYDRYIERLRHYAQQLRIGAQSGLDVHVGSLTNERELLRAEAFIQDAVSKGAEVIFGGRRRPDLGPLFYEPAILVNVNHEMQVMREETFGPLIPIMRVKDTDEALRLANDSVYGLSAPIFTRDLKRGEQLATKIESGDVTINSTKWVFGNLSLPMGGVKNSGMGRRNGPEGLMRFVKSQSVLVDNQLADTPVLSLYNPPIIQAYLKILRPLRKRLPFLRV